MILYSEENTLEEYEEALALLQKELRDTKIRYFTSRISLIIFFGAILLTLGVFAPKIPTNWLYVPIIIAIFFVASSFKISISAKENALSDFLNADYNGILRDIRHDIRTVTYYIDCLKKGEIPDPTYAYICSE